MPSTTAKKPPAKTRPKKAKYCRGPAGVERTHPRSVRLCDRRSCVPSTVRRRHGDGHRERQTHNQLRRWPGKANRRLLCEAQKTMNHRPQSAALEILIKSHTKHICHSPHHRRWTAQCAIVQLKSMRDRRGIRYFDVGAGGRRMLHCAGDVTRPTCEPKSTRTRDVMSH